TPIRQTSGLAVRKAASVDNPAAVLGAQLEYTITVTNSGNGRRHTVSSRDWGSGVCASVPTLEPGAANAVSFPTSLVVTQAMVNEIGRASCRERVADAALAAAGKKEDTDTESTPNTQNPSPGQKKATLVPQPGAAHGTQIRA